MAGAHPKILILEDEVLTAHYLKENLARFGYEVAGVYPAAEAALEAAERNRPDLLLADIKLQGKMNGIEVAAHVRRQWGIPTIFLTAYADSETLKQAQETEPYGYLVKPFSAEELHTTIQVALHQHGLFHACKTLSDTSVKLLERTKEDLRSVGARLVSAQEEEQKRIARDLHDDLGQRLALLQIGLDRLKQQLWESCPEDARRQFRHLLAQLAQISEDLRRIAHGLHPSSLDDLGLAVALRGLAREFHDRHSIPVWFSARNVPQKIPGETALCLYRIAQEALNNIAKHAQASSVDMTLAGDASGIMLLVRDSGRGFDPEAAGEKKGLGLISMRQRAELLSGTFQLRSHPGRGTEIVARIPLPANTGFAGYRDSPRVQKKGSRESAPEQEE